MKTYLDGAIKASNEANPAAEGDYIDPESGLLMCGKCHTRKQMRFDLLGAERVVNIACECRRKQAEAERARLNEVLAAAKLEERRAKCFGGDRRKAGFTFAADDGKDPKNSRLVRRYGEKFGELRERGRGLLLMGPVGTGKTFLACALANMLMEQGYSVRVTTFSTIAAQLQSTFEREAVYASLNRVDLLVLDDLEAERNTSFLSEVVFSVIDNRLSAQKPIVVTTNLTPEALLNPPDQARARVYSRLQEACIPLSVTGEDRRRAKLLDSAGADLAYLEQG